MRQRMLWIRAGGAVGFLMIAGVVTAHFLTGPTHPILWNDLDLAPLNTATANVPVRAPEHLSDKAWRSDTVHVTVNPIPPASAAAGVLIAEETPAGYGWTNHGPLWGGGRFARLTSTGGHSAAGGSGGHAGGAATGSLSRLSGPSSKAAPHAASVHHGSASGSGGTAGSGGSPAGSGGLATIAITAPITDILFTTDLTIPTGSATFTLADLLGGLGGTDAGGLGSLSLTPEPGSLILMATGLLGLFGAARRLRKI